VKNSQAPKKQSETSIIQKTVLSQV